MIDPPGAQGWPRGVKQISLEELGRLGINEEDQLFWDGRRIEVKRSLVLTRLQNIIAVLVTVSAVLGGVGAFTSGLNDASEFLCARNVQWLSCSMHEPVAPASARP